MASVTMGSVGPAAVGNEPSMGVSTPDATHDPCDANHLNQHRQPSSIQEDNAHDQSGKDAARVLTPPTSDDMGKRDEPAEPLDTFDEDEEEDIGEVEPDHYWDGGRIPVFKPTMRQFKDFQKFISKVDKYGMRSGIVKVIPPPEWKQSLPDLSEAVKTIRVKNPITQEFAGTHGTYTQANIEKQRSYNLVQWKALTMESNHQPPARRGERRRQMLEVITPKAKPQPQPQKPVQAPVQVAGVKRGRGRPRKNPVPSVEQSELEQEAVPSESVEIVQPEETGQQELVDTVEPVESVEQVQPEQAELEPVEAEPIPPTPVSNKTVEELDDQVKLEIKEEEVEDSKPEPAKRGRGRPPKTKREGQSTPAKQKAKSTPKSTPRNKGDVKTSVTSRRMHYKRETYEVDEEAFQGFDYHLEDVDQFSADRCKELEETYWRTINYGTPMYGADMPGSLFEENRECWNVAKLPNLLDVLGTKVPGVNTAYLYLGMWKATFAWHLEDVDLYSINYIHFGAPKQWYSISQEDARKFESAMRKVWPNDAKHCDQFLRHKTYLISPEKLKSQYNITVNKLVHYEGEFVITYPYGYHSGFNLGYNCAESVNFANEDWLNYGRISKKCNCEADSVWVDVYEIERKLRGEPTPEFYLVTDDELDDDEHDTPVKTKKKPGRKRKQLEDETLPEKKYKKVKMVRVKAAGQEPCILCPNDIKYDKLLPTDNGKMAHRLCAIYTPETYLAEENGFEKVFNVAGIDKARLELRCMYCRSKKGTCFQCSSKKCHRAYHATCAAAAGVQIDTGPVPTWGEDGTEYVCEGYDFRCRFHRPKRSKNTDVDALEKNSLFTNHGKSLKAGDVIQALHFDGEVFGGLVVENRPGEMACLVEVLPDGDHVEVEWKWLLVLDPADSERPKPSADAKPLPEHLMRHEMGKNKRQDGVPEEGDAFHDPIAPQKWAEFHSAANAEIRNPIQSKVDMFKVEKLWHYIPKGSTDAKPQYTHDPRINEHNTRSNFLESVRPAPVPFIGRHSLTAGGKMALPAQGLSKQYGHIKPRTSLPGNTSIPPLHYSSYMQWQHQQQRQYGPTSSGRPTYGQTMPPNYGHQGYQPIMARKQPTQTATAAPQDLMRDSRPSHQHQPQVMRMDNSPSFQNFYAQAETKYISQPYYSHKLGAPLPKSDSLEGSQGTSHQRTISVEHSVAIASLQNPNQLPSRSPTLDRIPFMAPSYRPEIRDTVIAENKSEKEVIEKKGPPSKPDAMNGYMEQAKRARAVSNRINNSRRLLAGSVSKHAQRIGSDSRINQIAAALAAGPQPSPLSLGPPIDPDMLMPGISFGTGSRDVAGSVESTSALFSSLINHATPTPEPQSQGNGQGQNQEGNGTSTPPSVIQMMGLGTPERPDFSPISEML
jgi:hypothetical protein